MNMEKVGCQEAYEKNQEIDSKDRVLHTEMIVIFRKKTSIGGRARVITDEDRVLRAG